MATVNNMYELVIHFRNGDLGWNEKHHLKATTYALARVAAAKVISFRRALSPADVEIVYARVGKVGKPRDALPVVLSYPLAGNSSVVTDAVADHVGNPSDAFYARLSAIADEGESDEIAVSVSTFVRGLPDDVVNSSGITLPDESPIVVTVTDPEPAAVGTPATYAVAIGNYLAVLLGQTRYSKRLADVAGPPIVLQFDALNWSEVVFRGYTSRKCGRPFTLRPGRDAG